MARSLGLSLLPDGFTFAFLEGSAKRFVVKACGSGRLDPSASDSSRALGKALARAVKQAGMGKANEVVAAVPSLDTVLRELSLPFSDREKVHQVLKFEVESDLYHLDIDEVVCDFLEVDDNRATSTILVAAEPKADIAMGLEICDEAGYDPEILELDLGALVTTLLEVQKARGAGEEMEAFLHIGPYSSLLLVLEGTRLRAVRSIRVGWRELARGMEEEALDGVRAEEPQAEVVEVEPAPSEDIPEYPPPAADTDAGGGADEEEEEEKEAGRPFGADASLPVSLDVETVLARSDAAARTAMVRRLASEVRRGLAAVASAPVVRLHLLGPPIPALDEALQARLGIPAAQLELGFSDPDGIAPDPIALGAALRGLGATASRMNLRQEEYRRTRGLERVEGPLTWMLVGLIAFLLVDSVVLFQRSKSYEKDAGLIFNRAAAFVGRLNENLREDDPADWRIRTDFEGYDLEDLERISRLRNLVRNQKDELDELIGAADVAMPESCLEAWRLIMKVLDGELGDYDRFGNRWMLEGLDLTSQDGSTREEANVTAKLGLTLFGQDATAIDRKFEAVMAALDAAPWAVGTSSIPSGIQMADAAGGRNGVINFKVSTTKGREAGL